MDKKKDILDAFSLFSLGTGGIGSWLTNESHDDIFARLAEVDTQPLSAVQLNQLLVLGHEAPVSDAFFQYYWLMVPPTHPYDVRSVPGYMDSWKDSHEITSLEHLKWGLYRLYTDALLYFGNVRTAFRSLRDMSLDELQNLFAEKRFDTLAIERRGPPLPLKSIIKDNRYLISEMACKSYGDIGTPGDLQRVLMESYERHLAAGNPAPTIRQLLGDPPAQYRARQQEFLFSADEVLDDSVTSAQDLSTKYEGVAAKFAAARQAALDNTRYYLSMVNDLDVYVATSMRNREDFRTMADTCERIFSDARLKGL